jgi:hypothetical protein
MTAEVIVMLEAATPEITGAATPIEPPKKIAATAGFSPPVNVT